MIQAKRGDKVTVHYTGKLVDGSIFDSTAGEDPLVFTLGESDIIDGFEEAVLDMAVGDKKTVTLPPEKAYGERDEENIMEVPLSDMPADFEFEVGDELELVDEEGEPILVVVKQVSADTVTFDGNPPLAGQTLIFDLELIKID